MKLPFLLLAGLLALGGLSLVHADALPRGATYVAMGSSFAAGPGVATRAPDGPAACGQSVDNYPRLLARKRGFHLIDRTCSGATTANILDTPQAGQPPQIEGVGPDTRLVTVTIGGNDISYIANLWARSCRQQPDRVPAAERKGICRIVPPATVQAEIAGLPARMHRVVAVIRARAPKAQIVLVSYVSVVPATGRCPDLPLSAADRADARAAAARLLAITEATARADGTKYVSGAALTRGHEVCSPDPWIEGFHFSTNPASFGPVPYHPDAKAMAAIAAALDRTI